MENACEYMTVFIVLHYMVYEETAACVDSILLCRGNKKIIIVDNGSPNNSLARLRLKYNNNTDVVILHNEKNLGFAQGNNVGYRYAKKNFSPDFIVIMNNDMEIVSKDIILLIQKYYDKYHFHILSPDIFSSKMKAHQNPDNYSLYTLRSLYLLLAELRIKRVFRLLYPVRAWCKKHNNEERIRKSSLGKETVEAVGEPFHGSCLIFSTEYTKKYQDAFYPETFMYLEAQILFYIVKRDHLTSVYCPDIRITHHEDKAMEASYRTSYKQFVFINKCMIQSCKAFIQLMKNDGASKITS